MAILLSALVVAFALVSVALIVEALRAATASRRLDERIELELGRGEAPALVDRRAAAEVLSRDFPSEECVDASYPGGNAEEAYEQASSAIAKAEGR